MCENLGPLEYLLYKTSHHRVHHGADKKHDGWISVWDRVFTKQFILMSTPLNLQTNAISTQVLDYSNLFIHSSSVSKTLLALNLRRSLLSSQKIDAPAVAKVVSLFQSKFMMEDKKMIADPEILVCNHLLLVTKIFYNLKTKFLKHIKLFLDTHDGKKAH